MRRVYIYIIATVASLPVMAQQPDINKQVEVTKNFAPEVGQASKLTPEPRMIDTVALRPQSEYRISPQPWLTSFGVNAFSPIKVNTKMAKGHTPFYLKVGAGYPLNSLFDFYGWLSGARGSIGGYANHRGYYDKLTNDLNRKVSATESQNSSGIVAERLVGRRMSLKSEVGYDYDFVTRYGEFDLAEYPMGQVEDEDPLAQSYSTARASVEFGNDFKDLSYFNFNMGASGYHLRDSDHNNESNILAFAQIGKQFNVHRMSLKASFDSYSGSDSLHYYNRIITVSPRYEIEMSRFRFKLGGDYVHDMKRAGNKSHFFPKFNMTFDLTAGYFVPFIDIDGELQNYGYRNTVLLNPYVTPGLVMENSAVYNGRGGISGSFASSFSYRVFAGISVYSNMNTFANIYRQDRTAEFTYINDKASLVTVGGDINGRISGSFTLLASGNLYGYTMKNFDKVGTHPNFDASLDLRYRYRNKFRISAGAKCIGNRYFYEFVGSDLSASGKDEVKFNKITPVVDLHLEAEYRINKLIGVFVEGNNLLNAKLYPYNHYRGFGISGTAGVKLNF